jgi:hypothetical protein
MIDTTWNAAVRTRSRTEPAEGPRKNATITVVTSTIPR